MGSSTARPLDVRALERHAARLMQAPAPWLHEEVARRMAERLVVLKRAPQRVVDWSARTGGSEAALRRACPQARRARVDAFALQTVGAAPVVQQAPGWRAWWQRLRRHGGPGTSAPAPHESTLREGEADLLWANMALHHLADPGPGMARWLRLLAVDGILMFSTLGPGTLASLRRLYAAHRWPAPHAPFIDMHDLGDMLVQAGFADPVMDQEVITLSWADPAQALAELRGLGGNADLGRHRGLRTPRWRRELEAALVQSGPGDRVALEFEVVYGHAVRPLPRAKVAAETTVPLEDLRGMLRRGDTRGTRDTPGARGAR